MIEADLAAELAVALSRRPALPAGISPALRHLVGAAPVLIERGRFQFMSGGPVALITPIRTAHEFYLDDEDHLAVPSFGDLIDLCAWHPSAPSQWALRSGLATWLGSAPPQIEGAAPVPVLRSVYSWLRHGATGICLLTRAPAERQALLQQCRSIDCEDAQHRTEVARLLRYPAGNIPPVFAPVDHEKKRAAA